jgi:hypothetical protein
VAKRNSGKSHLMKHLLHKLMKEKAFDWVLVFSATKFNNEWCDIVGEKNVCDEFNPDWVMNLLDKQGALVKKRKAKPGLILIDDMIGTANFKSDVITKIAIASRHYKITCWISSQYYTKLPPVIRQNSDYVYILNNINETVSRKIHEEFPCATFKTWKDVYAYAEEATQNFGVMLINNSSDCFISS